MGALYRWVARLVFGLTGWRVEGGLPPGLRKAVIIQAPHTSNWDFPIGMFGAWMYGISFQWLGKDSLFRPPLGWLLSWLGGVPVDRSAPQGLVREVAATFERADGLALVIPPEGTRGARPYWKSGFYWIAAEARVPIVCGIIDYERKVAGFSQVVVPSGDLRADMDRIRAIYEPIRGLYPEGKSRIRLPAEDGAPG